MSERVEIADGIVLERHQCQWTQVNADPPYLRCWLTWGDGTRCGQIAMEPTNTYSQWIWKDDQS